MLYLASPYSHPDPLIMKTRFLLAEQVTATLLASRRHVYSPIVHCHELATKYALPTDFAFWRGYNFDMLRHCEGFIILAIDGWKESVGVTAEAARADSLGLHRGFVNEEGEFF
jgi:hypothetical protein